MKWTLREEDADELPGRTWKNKSALPVSHTANDSLPCQSCPV